MNGIVLGMNQNFTWDDSAYAVPEKIKKFIGRNNKKDWLIENLKLKINEIDWKIVHLDIEAFLKSEDQKFIENWNKDFFSSILKKLELFLN